MTMTLTAAAPPLVEQAPSSARGRLVLAVTCVPAFMVGLDALVVTVALATIRRDLHASLDQLSWTVNAYVLAYGVLMLLGALLGDRFGRRRVFVTGLVIFSAASAACALAGSPHLLIAARAVQGVGAALITPLSLALATEAFPPGARGKAIGIWSAVMGAAVAAGPIVGGAVVQGISWQWIFWLNVPIGLGAAMLAPKLVSDGRGERRAIDVPGVALVSAGLLAMIAAIVQAPDHGWASAQVLAGLISGATLLAGFAAWQARTAHPLLPRHLFTRRAFVAANVATFLLAASLYGAAFLVPQYLQGALHTSPLGTGVRILPWTAVTLVITPLAGALADRIGNRPLIVAGLACQAGGFAWLSAVTGPTLPYWQLFAPLLLAGVGISLVFPAVANAVVGGVAPHELGVAAATNSSFRQIGGPFGVAVAAVAFQHYGGFGPPSVFAAGVTAALALAAALSAVGALAGVAVGRRRA